MSSNNRIVYLNGAYVSQDEAKISPMDRGFLFGDGIYEAMPFYQGRPFALDQHWKRFQNGLAFLRIIGFQESQEQMATIFQTLLVKNQVDTVQRSMIYLQVTRGAPPTRNHAFPMTRTAGTDDAVVPPTIFVFCQEIAFPTVERWNQGFTSVLQPDRRWGRVDIKTVNLLANVLAYQDAKDQGVDEAILHKDGVAMEGTHANFFVVLDDEKNTIVTHPITSHHILPGITRAVLLEAIAHNNNNSAEKEEEELTVQERPLTVEELRDHVKEAFLTSTTSEVKPIVSIDGRPLGDGSVGPVTRRLAQLFRERIERDTGVTILMS